MLVWPQRDEPAAVGGPGPRRPRARRRIILLAVGLAVLLALVAAPFAVGSYVRGRVLPEAQQRLGCTVTAADVSVGFGRVVLDDVVVSGPNDAGDAPLVRAARVEVSFALLPAIIGRARIGEVRAERARLAVRRYADGRDNVREVLARARGRRGGGEGEGGGHRTRPTLTLRQGSLDLVDERRGVTLRAAGIDGQLRPGAPATVTLAGVRGKVEGGPEIGIERLAATIPPTVLDAGGALPSFQLSGGSVAPLHSLALTGIRGTIAPAAAGRVAIDLRGGYGGVPEELWTATGEVLPHERTAQLDVTAARFTLDKLKPILKDTPVIEPEQGTVDASLKIQYAAGTVAFDGGLQVAGLALFHRRLGPVPVRKLDAIAQVRGAFVPAERRLRLDEAAVTFRNVKVFASGEASQVGRPTARYEARVRVPPVPCQVALSALPEELTPALKGFELKGTFQLDLHTKIDMMDLDRTELGGEVGIRGCQAVDAPPTALKLGGGFQHRVQVAPGREMTFWVGPDNPNFVAFADISPSLFAALTTTEDGGFFHHRGFIPSTFRAALVRNLRRGYFALGASSITMQMVKNALLAREKTLARKLQELFLTWFVETRLNKQRIMELYLNIIEFGPALYGIGAATRHYFGKPASQITPLEAAFYASILPNPKKRYVQYCKGQLTPDWDRYVRRILMRMHERGRITDEEYEQYATAEFTFSREEFKGEKECYAAVAEATTRLKALDDEDDADPPPVVNGDDGDGTPRPGKGVKRRAAPADGDDAPPPPRRKPRRRGAPPGAASAGAADPAPAPAPAAPGER
ncbi:MAG TPA: transglycosylase domain-containing protein [Polyangia bacterium]